MAPGWWRRSRWARHHGSPWKLVALVVGGLGLGLAIGAARRPAYELAVHWLGPPEVALREAYADGPAAGGATFDHGAFARVLHRRVDDAGRVDYQGLHADPADLDAYVAALADAPFDALHRDGKLALLVNAYNACTLRLILDHWPIGSIQDIPAAERWEAARWVVGGRTLSLDAIEHEELRAKFVEPRIHFALVCASVGCPPLAREPYAPERLDAQLDAAARRVHDPDGPWVDLDLPRGRVGLTPLYLWYDSDFERVAGSPLGFAARYLPDLARTLDRGGDVDLRWLEWDWSLNAQRPAPTSR